MILRYSYIEMRDIGRMTDIFYWPVINLLLWGITSLFIQKNAPNLPFIILMIISGVVFWQVIWRGNMEVTMNFLEEMWNKNLINLYSSPLRLSETVVAMIFMSIVKACITTIVGAVVAFFHKYNIFVYGLIFSSDMLLLLMSGWAIGFLLRVWCLIRHTDSDASLDFYPDYRAFFRRLLSNFHFTALGSDGFRFLPTSYIFEAARGVISNGHLDMHLLDEFVAEYCRLCCCNSLLFGSMKNVLEKGLVKVF